MALFGKLTGSQMQAIADANAKADITKHGKKYGNLQKKITFWQKKLTTKAKWFDTNELWIFYIKKLRQDLLDLLLKYRY